MHSVFDRSTLDRARPHPTDAHTLQAPSHDRDMTPGQSLYLSGDPASMLYRLDRGLVRVLRMTADGGVVTVRHVLPGDVFGEEALTGATHTTSAEALVDARVASFDPAYLDASDTLLVLHSLAAQTQRMMDYGYHLQAGDLHQRVARYLVWLAATPLATVDGEGTVSVAVTHELVAEGTGSTRESVSKIITELRGEGAIASGYRSIQILDAQHLEWAAEGM